MTQRAKNLRAKKKREKQNKKKLKTKLHLHHKTTMTTLPQSVTDNLRVLKSYKRETTRNGYFYPFVLIKERLHICLSVSSSTKSNRTADFIGGYINEEKDNNIYDGLLREICEETCFGLDVILDAIDDVIYFRSDFFDNNSHTNVFTAEVNLHFHKMKKTIESIDAVKVISEEDLERITKNQLEFINTHDADPRQKVIPKDFLEKRGMVIYPVISFLNDLKKLEELPEKERAQEIFIEVCNDIPKPNDESRTPQLPEFKDKSERTYKVPAYVCERLRTKRKFFENAIELIKLGDYVF